MRGAILEACNCNVSCPCNFGSDPTQVPCDVVIGFHIEQGSHGNTQLDGLNWVFYARVPGNFFAGGFTMGVYLDQRANQEQAQALGTILSGQAGGMFGPLNDLISDQLAPKQVPIQFEMVDGNAHITVPGLLEVGLERIPHPTPGQPPLDTKVSDLAVSFYTGTSNVRRSSVLRLTDPDLSFEYAGSSCLIGQFDYTGP